MVVFIKCSDCSLCQNISYAVNETVHPHEDEVPVTEMLIPALGATVVLLDGSCYTGTTADECPAAGCCHRFRHDICKQIKLRLEQQLQL